MATSNGLIVTPLLIALSLAVPCAGEQYYLAPWGDDDNNAGTNEEDPWKTIGKANRKLEPGDQAIFLPGEYPGTISPAWKPETPHEAHPPIVYRSAVPHGAVLISPEDDLAHPERDAVVYLYQDDYITVEGFGIDVGGQGTWVDAADCHHLTIRGCVMRNSKEPPVAMIRYCEQVKLLDNVFRMDHLSGNMCHILKCSYVLIEGNSFSHAGHAPMQITTSRNVVVRANCFMTPWGRNYEICCSGRLLVEDNIMTRARDSAHSADSLSKNLYIDSIFRFNRVFGNLHTPLDSYSYMSDEARRTHYIREPFRMLNSRIYHNTIAGNLGHGWEIRGLTIAANEFANNIFWRNDWGGGNVQFVFCEGVSRDNRVRGNLFRGTEDNQAVINYRGKTMTVADADDQETTHCWAGFWSEMQDNEDADPAFVGAARNDFRLGERSGAIDAGVPLALAIGRGEDDSKLLVTDGRPFFDGLGIEGEGGDLIAVGAGSNVARIERIEFRYCLPAILHLDRDLTWKDGNRVSLPWSGANPDAGAFEHGGAHPSRFVALAEWGGDAPFAHPFEHVRVHPSRPVPGMPVRFSLDTLGKWVRSVRWDFRDGSFSDELAPEHAYENAGDYGVLVRCTFLDGEDGVAVVFVGVEEPADPNAPLVQVDFEDDTYKKHWGYHFKFYRRWLTGAKHVERDGGGKCMVLLYDPDKENRAAAAVAPGVWEIDCYPIIRFSYRIPPGVPVGICVEQFESVVPVAVCTETFERPPGWPGWILGGTRGGHSIGEYIKVRDGPELIDDGDWREVELDLREIEEMNDVTYLRRFMFYCNWRHNEEQQFCFDDFAILPPPE